MTSLKGFVPMTVTLLSVAIGICLKRVSRKPQNRVNVWNDLAIAPDLTVAALVLFMTAPSNTRFDPNITGIGVLVIAVIMFLACSITKRWGWKDEISLSPITGVIIPDVIGILLLFVCTH